MSETPEDVPPSETSQVSGPSQPPKTSNPTADHQTVARQLRDALDPNTDDQEAESSPPQPTDEPSLGSVEGDVVDNDDESDAEDDVADEPGDPSVDPELLDLHVQLEAEGKTAEDMASAYGLGDSLGNPAGRDEA